MANTKNSGTTTSPIARASKPEAKRLPAKGEVQVQIYFKYYYFKVDTALPESIRLTQINHLRASKRQAPSGSKGYKAPAAKTIYERLIAPWKNRNSAPNGAKVEFSSESTKGYTVPFALVKFG